MLSFPNVKKIFKREREFLRIQAMRNNQDPWILGGMHTITVLLSRCQDAAKRSRVVILEADYDTRAWRHVRLYCAVKYALDSLLRGDRLRAVELLKAAKLQAERK